MKKIILGIFVMFLFVAKITLAADPVSLVGNSANPDLTQPAQTIVNPNAVKTTTITDTAKQQQNVVTQDTAVGWDPLKAGPQDPSTIKTPDQTINWMTIGKTCLLNGQCKFSFYKFLGIRQSVEGEWKDPTSPELFIQDIILAATTFIGSLLAISIIVSGLMYIFAGASGKEPTKAKSGIINSIIWLIIVLWAYAIIRIVQYIAKGF